MHTSHLCACGRQLGLEVLHVQAPPPVLVKQVRHQPPAIQRQGRAAAQAQGMHGRDRQQALGQERPSCNVLTQERMPGAGTRRQGKAKMNISNMQLLVMRVMGGGLDDLVDPWLIGRG